MVTPTRSPTDEGSVLHWLNNQAPEVAARCASHLRGGRRNLWPFFRGSIVQPMRCPKAAPHVTIAPIAQNEAGNNASRPKPYSAALHQAAPERWTQAFSDRL